MNMDEMNAKLNAFANNLVDFFKTLPQTIKNLPQDEQISYGAITVGVILMITAIIVW